MTVGVLAFQGDIAEHVEMLHSLRVPAVEVRSTDDLAKVDALIIPGGESTVIGKFLTETGTGKEISHRSRDKKHPLVVYGTCAGAIVLARTVTGKNAPKSLGLIDITIERNAYGTQAESFEAELTVRGLRTALPVSFIRAPKITRVGRSVEVLAQHDGDPVLVRQENILVGTFHPEMRGARDVHRLFLQMASKP